MGSVERGHSARPRFHWRRFAFFAALLFGMLSLVAIVRRHDSEDRWEEALDRVDAWQAALEQIDRERSVLYGEPLDGEAWESYERAFSRLTQVDGLGAHAAIALYVDEEESREQRIALLRDAAPALDALRDGAHRRLGARAVEWTTGHGGPSLEHVRTLVELALARQELALEEGEEGSGVEFWLDALQLARDLSHTPRLIDEVIGTALMSITLDQLQLVAPWTSLSETDRQHLAQGLARLDADFELVSRATRGDYVLAAHSFQRREEESGLTGGDLRQSWRQPFSAHRLFAEYGDVLEGAARRYEGLWSSASATSIHDELRELQSELARSSNPYAKRFADTFESSVTARIEAVTRLRLLRVALAYAIDPGNREFALSDPYGTELRLVQDDDGVRWSAASASELWPATTLEEGFSSTALRER